MKATEYLIVRDKSSDELRICRVMVGYKPPRNDPEYTWSGPFPSQSAARKAINQKLESVRLDLYPEDVG